MQWETVLIYLLDIFLALIENCTFFFISIESLLGGLGQ